MVIIEHETTTRNGEPAIRVRLDYDEAREYLALDEKWIDLFDSLTEGERDEVTIELYLVPLREVAETQYMCPKYARRYKNSFSFSSWQKNEDGSISPQMDWTFNSSQGIFWGLSPLKLPCSGIKNRFPDDFDP